VKCELIKIIVGQVFLHACMAGMRMASPLLALREGHSEAAVGFLLALFALTQVFLALPAGRYTDLHGLKRPVMWSVLMGGGGCRRCGDLAYLPRVVLQWLDDGRGNGLGHHRFTASCGARSPKRDANERGLQLALHCACFF
jgi:hypothetical protein